MIPAEERNSGQAAGVTVCYTPAVTARRRQLGAHRRTFRRRQPDRARQRRVLHDMVESASLRPARRMRRKDSLAPTPKDAWHWATASGYRALKVQKWRAYSAGGKADLIVIDAAKAHLVPTIRHRLGFRASG